MQYCAPLELETRALPVLEEQCAQVAFERGHVQAFGHPVQPQPTSYRVQHLPIDAQGLILWRLCLGVLQGTMGLRARHVMQDTTRP
jgi:hypothetical protein